MPRKFEIKFVDRNGELIDNPSREDSSNAIPILDLVVIPALGITGEAVTCRALLDTGADHSLAESSIIGVVGGNPLRTVKNDTVTGGNIASLYDLTLCLTDIDGVMLQVHADVVSTEKMNDAYQVILGRSLFRHGKLVFDYVNQVFEFVI